MKSELLEQLHLTNPWLKNPEKKWHIDTFYFRLQEGFLKKSSWDELCTVIIGPRQAGKTTLGFHTCKQILAEGRFSQLIYLNCDLKPIREFLKTPVFIQKLCEHFSLEASIFFIDEVQRLPDPGLLLKSIIDLKLPHKIIASGSSQLEIKSKVVEYLTGREIEATILPMSYEEYKSHSELEDVILYGAYPQIIKNKTDKDLLLKMLYRNYINKDIIEFLKVEEVDELQSLVTLLAHQSGQLVNYQQLAIDCQISVHKIKNLITILSETYVIKKIKPFVGNKRTEITSNPIIYFLDNGFRNQALNNFTSLENRNDTGLLIENFVFQEILKLKLINNMNYNIFYWRTKSGAEVDFVLQGNEPLPIEIKYKNFEKPTISKSFRSFIDAYQPLQAIIITKNFYAKKQVKSTTVYFIDLKNISQLLTIITKSIT